MKISEIKGVSPAKEKALRAAGIHTDMDLLFFLPRRLLDRTALKRIQDIDQDGEQVTINGTITQVTLVGGKSARRLEAVVTDGTGMLKVLWFKGVHYFSNSVKKGLTVVLFGTVKRFGHQFSMVHPEMKLSASADTVTAFASLMPVYPSNQFFERTGITDTFLQKTALHILEQQAIAEFLPSSVLSEYHLLQRMHALRAAHAPDSFTAFERALYRFKFEELFLFQLAIRRLKLIQNERSKSTILGAKGALVQRFFKTLLPFELTEGQRSALRDIARDVQSGHQMNRLIQGDVGSGKTVVALGALLMALDEGLQTAFMAPTEILAEQHFHTIHQLTKPLELSIRLLTGSTSAATRREILADIAAGTCQIVIGTHALFQQDVRFAHLGLIVVDEQHRFGVMQRADLSAKGNAPHVLVMSATPIPRSLALTLYGDLDISQIKGLPGGRKPIKTAVRQESKREDVYQFIEQLLQDGGQAYIVYPLIDESEVLDLKNATDGFQILKERFSCYKIGLLHGKMTASEKESIMRAFKANELQLLVSTTVIEVGVDVPNASVMVVEHAERFGLSQLHQLRGRIGRGSRQSYCILMTDVKQSKEARIRLKAMEDTNDGFAIAEIDLELRGPGDFLGTKQSGLPEFKFANLVEDQPLIEVCKKAAEDILAQDMELTHPEHRALKSIFDAYMKDKLSFAQIG